MSVSLEYILLNHKIARKIAGYSDKQAEKEIGEHYLKSNPKTILTTLVSPRSHVEASGQARWYSAPPHRRGLHAFSYEYQHR